MLLLIFMSINVSGQKAVPETRDREEAAREREAQEFFMQKAQVRPGTGISYSYGDGVFVTSSSGSSSSQLSLSKVFDGETKSSKGTFNVDETVQHISFSLQGGVKSGSITIKITLPNDDLIKEITIDETAEVRYNQSIRIAEDDKKYYGNWHYSVDAQKAEGEYRLMLSTR